MCLSNVVQVLLTQNDQNTPKSNVPCKLTKEPPLYYSRCELIQLRQPDKHVNLLGAPAGLPANIRKLRLNKE